MKKLTNLYRVDMNEEELAEWYNKLKNIKFHTFYTTIEKIDANYMPNAIELKKLCEGTEVDESFKILDIMWADGYFKYGAYGELAPEQQSRNFDKALTWLNTGIIPAWFKKDMKEYETKLIPSEENIKIGEPSGRTSLQLPNKQSYR